MRGIRGMKCATDFFKNIQGVAIVSILVIIIIIIKWDLLNKNKAKRKAITSSRETVDSHSMIHRGLFLACRFGWGSRQYEENRRTIIRHYLLAS